MTVKDLIALLQHQPPDMEVVVDCHSEYDHVREVKRIKAVENGGYVSRTYGPTDEMKAHGYVYIG